MAITSPQGSIAVIHITVKRCEIVVEGKMHCVLLVGTMPVDAGFVIRQRLQM
jgi:hypothetical protein